jgi:hypothetical protein
MVGLLRVGRRGAPGKIAFDHVGENGARLDEIESCDGRIHLIETFAAAQKLGIDRADLVEHLLEFAEVGKKLRDLRINRVRHVAEPRTLACTRDCREVSLGAVADPIDAVTIGSTAAFVSLHQ